jgi:hypothetical protein
MTSDRGHLLDFLRRITAGGTITNEELREAIPDPGSLDTIEAKAWERLSHWADDGDIRTREDGYRVMQEDQIEAALVDLEALEAGFWPEEVERGDHSGSHISPWSCLISVALVAAALVWAVRQLL